MSRTVKHTPKPDRFTRRHRTAAHAARSRQNSAMQKAAKREAAGLAPDGTIQTAEIV